MTKNNVFLKIKSDTFFLPTEEGVYFKNNMGSFSIKGKSAYKLVETIMPSLNGEYTLEDITRELPSNYAKAIENLCLTLKRNGFLSYQKENLSYEKENIEEIEFLDYFTSNPVEVFEHFVNSSFILVGKGQVLTSVLNGLLKLGAKNIVMYQETEQSNVVKHIMEYKQGRKKMSTESQIDIQQIAEKKADLTIYASDDCNDNILNQLLVLNTKVLPITYIKGIGGCGPLLDENLGWNQVKKRLQLKQIERDANHNPSIVTGALLANVALFNIFKFITDSVPSNIDQMYILNLETLEGDYHYIFPNEFVLNLEETESDVNTFYRIIDKYTDEYTGIFTDFNRNDLSQIPLPQWKINVSLPLDEGFSKNKEIIGFGEDHKEARYNTCVSGIEYFLKHNCTDFNIGPNESQIGKQSEPKLATGISYLKGEKVILPVNKKNLIFTVEFDDESLYRYSVFKQILLNEVSYQNRDGFKSINADSAILYEQNDMDRYYNTLKIMNAVPNLSYKTTEEGLNIVKVESSEITKIGIGFTFQNALVNAIRSYLNKIQNNMSYADISQSCFKSINNWQDDVIRKYLVNRNFDVYFFDIEHSLMIPGLRVNATLLFNMGK